VLVLLKYRSKLGLGNNKTEMVQEKNSTFQDTQMKTAKTLARTPAEPTALKRCETTVWRSVLSER
jgi:hypothetical protein